MALDRVTNFGKTRLNGSVNQGDTSVTVDDGSQLPSAPFQIVVFDETKGTPADDSGSEIMRVTDVSSNTLTVERGKEGTSDQAHDDNEIVYQTYTAKNYNEIRPEIEKDLSLIRANHQEKGNPLVIPEAAASNVEDAPSGYRKLFFDTDNSQKLTSIDSAGNTETHES